MYTYYEAKRIRLLVGILYVVQPPMLLGAKYKAMLHCMYSTVEGRGSNFALETWSFIVESNHDFFLYNFPPYQLMNVSFYYILCISDADNQDKKWICAVGKFNELCPYKYGHNCIRALRNISQFVRIQYT